MMRLTALLLAALLAPAAQAQTTIRNSADAFVRPAGGFWNGQSFAGAASHYSAAYLSARSSVSSSMSFGLMAGSGSVSAASFDTSTNQAGAQAWNDDNTVADMLSIRSDSLAPGSAAMLEITLHLTSTVTGTNAGVTAVVFCYGATARIEHRASASDTVVGLCPTTVGAAQAVNGVFYGRAGVETAYGSSTEAARASFDGSAWYSIRMLTPDAYFASASGYNYLPPPAVPEPMSAALMAVGMGVLALRRRRMQPKAD
jgi:hypothetical protein